MSIVICYVANVNDNGVCVWFVVDSMKLCIDCFFLIFWYVLFLHHDVNFEFLSLG